MNFTTDATTNQLRTTEKMRNQEIEEKRNNSKSISFRFGQRANSAHFTSVKWMIFSLCVCVKRVLF